jgi:NAD+ diphosphatase
LNGKNLFRQSDTSIEAYFFNSEQLKAIFPNGIDSPIFLGVTNNINYVGVDLDQNNSEMDLWCNKNSIIVEDLRKYGPTLNDVDASFLSLNNGMTFWHKTHQFCGSCGFKNNTTEAGFVKVCSNIDCGKSHFPRTDPAIITLISYKDKVLLGRSPRFPEGMYSTLAGFVEPGESLEQALEREVFEEVGVKVKNIRYFNSQPWPFPASLMLGFFAEAINEDMKIDYNEIEDAHWFSIEELRSLKHPLISGGFKLPRVDSIARRLVDNWINKFN